MEKNARCSSGACVDVERLADGVVLTSTLGPDKGRVLYNLEEWSGFVADVKDGKFDWSVQG
jgi:hypothetical protein